jgi:RNA polymerase sigma factor (sigma-70 family)
MNATLADIFLSNRKSLVRTVMRIVRDHHAAEDVAQETYIRVRKAIEIGSVEHVEAFLFQTAHNLALNHRRRRDMRNGIEREDVAEDDIASVAASVPSPETILIHRQRLQCIDAAIARLPERARTVWLLSRIEKWPYPKIAEHLGVSPNTVFNDLKLAHAHCLAALAKIDRD